VVVAGGGRHPAGALAALAAVLSHGVESSVEWVGLRGGLLPLLETKYFAGKTVAAPPRLHARLLQTEPQLRFSSAAWHRDGRLWSVACADATQAALALVQAQIGMSARRAIETTLGLTTTITPVHLASKPAGGEDES
jgi:transcriptional regulator GlxA family with amidase domain